MKRRRSTWKNDVRDLKAAAQAGEGEAGSAGGAIAGAAGTIESGLGVRSGCIVHDACHSMLYHRHRRRFLCFSFTPLHQWTLKSGERACIRIQMRALREMDCDTTCHRIFLQDSLVDPTYFDIPHSEQDW